MTIAIDLDNTWTRSPRLWYELYYDAGVLGHQIVMVTARRDPVTPDERARYMLPEDMPIIYTAGDFKKPCAEAAGYKVDIWIDDTPGMIDPDARILKDAPDQEL